MHGQESREYPFRIFVFVFVFVSVFQIFVLGKNVFLGSNIYFFNLNFLNFIFSGKNIFCKNHFGSKNISSKKIIWVKNH